jgi:hypothetical protein
MAVQNHELELLEGRYLLILFGLIVSSLLYHSWGAMKSSETPNVSPPTKGGCRSLRPWWVICLVVLLMTPGLGAVQYLGTASRSASTTHTPQPQAGVTQPWNLPRDSLSNLDPTRYTAWLGTRVVRPDDDADHCQFVNPDIFYVPQRRGGMPKPSDNGDDDDSMSPSLRQERHAKTHQMSTRSMKAARPGPLTTRQQTPTPTVHTSTQIRLVYECGTILGPDKEDIRQSIHDFNGHPAIQSKCANLEKAGAKYLKLAPSQGMGLAAKINIPRDTELCYYIGVVNDADHDPPGNYSIDGGANWPDPASHKRHSSPEKWSRRLQHAHGKSWL